MGVTVVGVEGEGGVGLGDPALGLVLLGGEGVAGVEPGDLLVAPEVVDPEVGVGVEGEGEAEC